MIWIQEPEVGSQSRMALSHPNLQQALPSGSGPPYTSSDGRATPGRVPLLSGTSQMVTSVSVAATDQLRAVRTSSRGR